MSEASLIERIAAATTVRAGTRIGIGDDAAVLDTADPVVVSHDLLVADVHFTQPTPAADLGWKALAVNLSDIAAMGATPRAALVGLALPTEEALDVDAFYRGMDELAEMFNVTIAGGDLSASRQLVIGVTAVGVLEDDRPPLIRGGAVPGDLVVVTGPLGASEAGRAQLEAGADDPVLVAAHRRPRPDFDAAETLRRIGAHAVMDCSDGLLIDVGRMADASSCAVAVALEDVPRAAGVDAVAQRLGLPPDTFAATAGEDYRLIAAVSADAQLPDGLTPVGRFAAGSGLTATRSGAPVEVSRTGYAHDV